MKGTLMLCHNSLQFTASITDLYSVLLLFLSWLFTGYTGCIFLWGFHAKQITIHVHTQGHACMHTHAPTCTNTCTHTYTHTQELPKHTHTHTHNTIHTHMISVCHHSSCAYLSLITFKAGIHLMISEMK